MPRGPEIRQIERHSRIAEAEQQARRTEAILEFWKQIVDELRAALKRRSKERTAGSDRKSAPALDTSGSTTTTDPVRELIQSLLDDAELTVFEIEEIFSEAKFNADITPQEYGILITELESILRERREALTTALTLGRSALAETPDTPPQPTKEKPSAQE